MMHPFDQTVNAKLSGGSFAAFDADWEGMSSMLDADLDKQISEKLSNYEVAPLPGDWAAMNASLTAASPLAWWDKKAPLIDLGIVLLVLCLWIGIPQDTVTIAGDSLQIQEQLLPLTQ